jgi:hypothetical protein
MAHRHHLSLWVSILVTAMSIPAPAALTAEVMTPVPPGAILAALDLEQTVPDAACVSRCAASRDQSIAWANKTLGEKGFYSVFSSNCTEEKGQPKCATLRQACKDACAPKYDNSCMAACEAPFQTCCHANKVAWENSNYNECAAQCPTVKAPAPQAGMNVRADPPKATDAALNLAFKTWGKEMLVAWEAYQATRPAADRAADDARRLEAFNEVRGEMTKKHASFSVVSGGGGRLWILRANGDARLMDIDDAAYFRRGAELGASGVDAALAQRLGLSTDELVQFSSTVQQWSDFGNDFKSGQVLLFRPGESGGRGMPVRKGSSEHSSVRGTINGGGDFI